MVAVDGHQIPIPSANENHRSISRCGLYRLPAHGAVSFGGESPEFLMLKGSGGALGTFHCRYHARSIAAPPRTAQMIHAAAAAWSASRPWNPVRRVVNAAMALIPTVPTVT